MLRSEFQLIRKEYFRTYRGLVDRYICNKKFVRCLAKGTKYLDSTYWSIIFETQNGISWRANHLMHPAIDFKKGDIIILYDGREFIFQNYLKKEYISCIRTNSEDTKRKWIFPGDISKVNGESLYKISPILLKLLTVIKE